jgi:hypothetical protein
MCNCPRHAPCEVVVLQEELLRASCKFGTTDKKLEMICLLSSRCERNRESSLSDDFIVQRLGEDISRRKASQIKLLFF